MKNLPKRQMMEKEKKCENNEGFCRKKCKAEEVEFRYCLSGKMCCISTYSTLITYLEKETVDTKHFHTTSSQHVYWRLSTLPLLKTFLSKCQNFFIIKFHPSLLCLSFILWRFMIREGKLGWNHRIWWNAPVKKAKKMMW